jgi:predicted nucleic acid-binding Zn ribbon protein
MAAERRCVVCGAPVGEQRPGRPALYCSVGCRRAREYERRRTQAALERVESSLAWHRERQEVGSLVGCLECGVDGPDRHVEFMEAERVRLTRGLRDLLADRVGVTP